MYMGDTNFQPIFDYIDEKITYLETGLRSDIATKDDIQKILSAIDAFVTQSKDNSDSILVLEHKTEKLEHWTIAAAEKMDVPYKP
jgi:hypothetical protein